MSTGARTRTRTTGFRPTSTARVRNGAGTRRHPPVGRRLTGVVLVIGLCFAGLTYRLTEIAALHPNRYVEFGEEQRFDSFEVPVHRGPILDRNGNELAITVTRPTVWADPSLVADPTTTAAQLSPLVGRSSAELAVELQRSSEFVYVARRMDEAQAERVREAALPGVFVMDEPLRARPADDLARAVIGVVGDDDVGLSGLELQYDELLAGADGRLVVETDNAGRRIPTGEVREQPAEASRGLVLTIDRSLQFEAERALARAVVDADARGGIAVISQPETGEILAIANLLRGDDGAVTGTGNNLALTMAFEPGSVNKVITVAAGLEEGAFGADTWLSVPDRLTVHDYTFSDHDPHGTEEWMVRDVVAQSSNVGTILLASQLGPETIDRYLRRFGFGARTGLDFPNESAGIMLDLEAWSGTSIGAIPIGQGIAVTPMQMLAAYNVVANDGVAVAPRLVTHGVNGGVWEPMDEPDGEQVISAETAAEVRGMLAGVVEDGTGQRAAIPGYAVAGKTGTARKPQDTGTYQDEDGSFHYVSTFAGFVPADDPKLSMIVVLDEPQGSIYAGDTAAPVFADLGRFALHHLSIPPSGDPVGQDGD